MNGVDEIALSSKLFLAFRNEQHLQDNQTIAVTHDSGIFCVAPLQLALKMTSNCNVNLKDAPGLTLSDIHRFDRLMHNISRSNPGIPVHVYAGTDPQLQVKTAFLLGCHLIASQGHGFEETLLAFRPLHQKIDLHFGLAEFKNSLRSLCCAKCLRWIDFDHSSDDELTPGSIQMDEYAHYSRYEPYPIRHQTIII
jgi:hypothetical protein